MYVFFCKWTLFTLYLFSSGVNLVGKLDPIPESPHVDHDYAINHSTRPIIQDLLAEIEQLKDEKRHFLEK